jgi:hypothetical protein
MFGGVRPHSQRKGTRGIPLSRLNPIFPSPRQLGYLSRYARADTRFPDTTLDGERTRAADGHTLTAANPHTPGDSHLNDTVGLGHPTPGTLH